MPPVAAIGSPDGLGRRPTAGWRALLGFWAGLLALTGGGAGLLAWLGPPEPAMGSGVEPGRPVAVAGAQPSASSSAPTGQEASVGAGPANPLTTPAGPTPDTAAPSAGSSAALAGPPSWRLPSWRLTESQPPAGATQPAGASAPPAESLAASSLEAPDPGRSVDPVASPPAGRLADAALGLPLAPDPPPLDALTAAFRTATAAARPIPPPDPALLEPGAHGPLPRIGPEGRSAIRTYGRGFDRTDPRPRLGLVIGGLGMNARLTEEAIRRLPGTVTLAFSPYARQVGPLLDQARARGMEVLVALPLEPAGYPTLNNAGDRALLTSLSPAENQDRLDWVLSRFPGYVGAIGALGPMRGERFAQPAEAIGALQDHLRGRGLLYVDPRPEPRAGVAAGPRAVERAWGRAVDLVVDEPATGGEINLKLEALERLARQRGPAGALGYAGEASPVLVDRIAAWAGGVEARGLVLAPVTAMIRRPEAPDGVPQGATQPVRARAP